MSQGQGAAGSVPRESPLPGFEEPPCYVLTWWRELSFLSCLFF